MTLYSSCSISSAHTENFALVVPFGRQRIQLTRSHLKVALKPTKSIPSLVVLHNPRRRQSTALICNASSNARCAAEQTATVTRQSSTITIAPVQGKEKSPDLDDGGSGFPPRDDDGGGGGGGGDGHNYSGGFFFFGFLAFLGFLKDKEEESGSYKQRQRRY
ncbi:hypothetical protein ZOSMA_425G00040 [Zostera marina]|uniref:Uncharacterized protein n=1 Tax=Zostera marina TaxID=29655 RepID=A0A0K9P4P3_ZOSMR|nr:hypothetical protein ZOSMA_425G00040 [Zostera marina]